MCTHSPLGLFFFRNPFISTSTGGASGAAGTRNCSSSPGRQSGGTVTTTRWPFGRSATSFWLGTASGGSAIEKVIFGAAFVTPPSSTSRTLSRESAFDAFFDSFAACTCDGSANRTVSPSCASAGMVTFTLAPVDVFAQTTSPALRPLVTRKENSSVDIVRSW